MGNPRGAKNIPICPLNSRLVAHHQGRNHARQLAISHTFKHGIPHALAQSLNRVLPRQGQALRRCIARPGPHVTGGLQALLPQPQLVVKPMGVAASMGGFEPHRQLPALCRCDVCR